MFVPSPGRWMLSRRLFLKRFGCSYLPSPPHSQTASSDQGLNFSSYESLRGLTLPHTVISPSYESDCWWMQKKIFFFGWGGGGGFHGQQAAGKKLWNFIYFFLPTPQPLPPEKKIQEFNLWFRVFPSQLSCEMCLKSEIKRRACGFAGPERCRGDHRGPGSQSLRV